MSENYNVGVQQLLNELEFIAGLIANLPKDVPEVRNSHCSVCVCCYIADRIRDRKAFLEKKYALGEFF
jgi:hypothetical protein